MYPATLFIVLYLCLAQNCSINCAVIGERDALWSFLLDLHIEYCGETDVCHMANHTEPSVDLFPLPCCVPCSCQATCESNQNCCPSRMRFKSISDVTTTPSDSDEQVIMTLERTQMDNMFNNTSTQKVQRDSSVLNEDNFRQTNRNDNGQHSEDLETTEEFHTETLFDNLWEKTTPCAVSAVNQPNERLNNTSYTNESRLKNIAMYYSVEFACLRPQLLYRLNQHPNSDAYEMVISYPEGFKDTVIVEMCMAGQNHKSIADVIPMTSKLTGLTYVNKDCLLCNEHEVQSKSVDEWRIHIIRQRMKYQHIIFMRPQSLMNTVNNHFCNVHFVPKSQTSVQKCKLYDVTSCNETGFWENYDYTIEKTCNAGETLPVIHTVEGDRLLLENVICVLCNTLSGTTENNRLECGYPSVSTSVSTKFHRQTLSVNYFGSNGAQTADEEDISVGYIETAILHNLKSDTCPDGSIKLLGRCIRTICPRDHYEEMARCIPLYNTLTGLDTNFKIKVTPEQDVEVKIAKTVAKKLKLRVSSLFTNIVSLQSRDIAVWFMPKSNGKTVHFYLIDIFVYNASQKVVYNRAVMELQDFFKTIKFLNRLQIAKEIALGLKYDIGRMLDYGAQLRNLHFLMDERLDYDEPPQNHVTISDINRCVRTEFTTDDIEKLGRVVYKIKQTNTILYKDQYDSDFDGDSHYLYACIDNFVDDKVKVRRMIKIPNHVHTTSTTPGDTKDAKDANGRLPLPGITTAVAVLLAVIFTIVLVKIKSRPTPRE